MASPAVADAIRGYLDGAWTACPLEYENEGGDLTVTHVRVEIASAFYEAASIGAGGDAANLYREEGTLFLHVFTPSGKGAAAARQHAFALVNLFRGLELTSGTLRFGPASIGLGETGDENGAWWRLTASVEWQKDHF